MQFAVRLLQGGVLPVPEGNDHPAWNRKSQPGPFQRGRNNGRPRESPAAEFNPAFQEIYRLGVHVKKQLSHLEKFHHVCSLNYAKKKKNSIAVYISASQPDSEIGRIWSTDWPGIGGITPDIVMHCVYAAYTQCLHACWAIPKKCSSAKRRQRIFERCLFTSVTVFQ